MIDILSTSLTKMRIQALRAGALDARGAWAIDFPGYEGFKVHVVTKGEGWLSVEGHPTRHHAKPGDCILQTSGKAFALASDPSFKGRIRADDLIETARNGVMTLNRGGSFFSITAHLQLDGHLPRIVFGHLPPVILIPGRSDQAAILQWSIKHFTAEFRGNQSGRSLMLDHLAPIMLLQIFRVYLSAHKNERSWLGALSDPKLSKAMQAIHSDYQRQWSLETLARVAGMSRSGFALSFKRAVGVAPMEYLTNWRMQWACDLLRVGDYTITAVANLVGYESESAFSAAFKRVINCRPGRYKRLQGSLPPA